MWLAAGALLVMYVALCFTARQPVALRPQRVGFLCAAALVLRAGLWGAGYPLVSDAGETIVLLGAAAGTVLVFFSRTWLVRDSLDHFRQQAQTATKGLLLQADEPHPGLFILPSRGGSCRLTVRPLTSRWLLVMLPHSKRPSKVELLVSWFSKQYPGPIPSLRIVLERKSR